MGRTLIAGFEPGVIPSTSGTYLYLASVAKYGSPSCVTSPTPVHGAYCGYFPAYSYLRTGVGGSVLVGRFYMRLSALPGSSTIHGIQIRDGSAGVFRFRVTAAGVLEAGIGTSPSYTAGPTLSTDTWYRIDFRLDVSGTTWTCDWQVDGSAQTQETASEASSTTFASIYFGSISSTSADVYMDSIVLDDSSGAYPIGATEVVPLLVNGNGTHSHTNGDFDYATDVTGSFSEGTTGTDFAQYVDDVGDGLDGIRQSTANGSGYVEVTFGNLPSAGTVYGVQPVAICRAASTSACKHTLKISDDGFTSSRDVLPDIGIGTSTEGRPITYNGASTGVGTKPSDSGGWTDSAVNALTARWGYSDDVSPNPYLMGLLLEVEYVPSGGPQTITPSGTITPAGALTRRAGKTLTGTVAPAGTVARRAAKLLAGALAPAGTIAKAAGKTLAGTVTPAGTVGKAIGKRLAGTITPAGTLVLPAGDAGGSDYLENMVLDWLLGGGTADLPDTLYLALYTSAPSDGGGGTEVAGTGYSRAAVANNPVVWPAAAAGAKTLAEPVTFPAATGSWGTVVAIAVTGAATAGHVLWHTAITPAAVSGGDLVQVKAGDLTVTLG